MRLNHEHKMETMTMTPAEAIVQMFAKAAVSRISGLLELRDPILYSDRDTRVGGQFGRRFGKIGSNTRTEVPVVYRNAFLWGCANHVRDLDHEVMLLGFGRTQASRNSITSIMKIVGEAHRVAPTPEAAVELQEHLSADNRNSVILVHNHPEHVLSAALAMFLGPEPLPSLTDRNAGFAVLMQRLQEQMRGNRFGNVRFFLVQNDEAAEFSGLNLGAIVDALRLYGPGLAAAWSA